MLDDLVDLIETLKTRIRDHGHTLRENETRTRMVLVDPLLCALGWDTRNPDLVAVEYSGSRGRADYALLQGGNPVATLEAKKLGEQLNQHLDQMLGYANRDGIPKAAITDGDRWRLYEVFKQASLEERLILEVRVADEPPVACAMKFLALWRRYLSAESVEKPVLPRDLDESLAPSPRRRREVPHTTHQAGTPLPDVDLQKYKQPGQLLFPDGNNADVKSWPEVLVEVVKWLVEGNRVRQTPLLSPTGRIWLNTRNRNSRGNPFTSPRKVEGLWFDGNVSREEAVKKSIRMLEKCQVNPSEVRLQLSRNT